MFSSLRRLSKAAIADYQSKARVEWVVAGHPSQVCARLGEIYLCVSLSVWAILTCAFLQVVLTISQLMWCRDMDNCLEGDHDHYQALQEFELTNFEVTTYSFHWLNYLSLYECVSSFEVPLQVIYSLGQYLLFIHVVFVCLSVFIFGCVYKQRLNALAALVRGNLPSLHRNIITALITIDVHARDIVTELVKEKVVYLFL